MTGSFLHFRVVRSVKKIVDADTIIVCELDQHLGGERDYARLILGIGVLRYVQVSGDLFLPNISIFSDAAQIFVLHHYHLSDIMQYL